MLSGLLRIYIIEMKKSSSTILAGIIILVVGMILICCNNLINQSGIIALGGILFILSGIVNVVLYVTDRDEEGNHKNKGLSLLLGWVVCVAAILLGVSMLIFNDTFTALVPLFFGLLIFFGSLIQFYVLMWGTRPFKLPTWLFSVPALMFVAALVIYFAELRENVLMIVTGLSFVIFGVGGFIEGFLLRSLSKAAAKHSESLEKI